jgi:hypothetical protein
MRLGGTICRNPARSKVIQQVRYGRGAATAHKNGQQRQTFDSSVLRHSARRNTNFPIFRQRQLAKGQNIRHGN